MLKEMLNFDWGLLLPHFVGKQWFVHCFSSFDRWPAMIEMDPDTEYYFQLENPESMFPVSLWIVLILEKINDSIYYCFESSGTWRFMKNSNFILFYYVDLHPWMFYSIFMQKKVLPDTYVGFFLQNCMNFDT